MQAARSNCSLLGEERLLVFKRCGFKPCTLEAQNLFIPYKGKGSQRSKRPPWLNHDLLGLLKSKREAHQRWRSGGLSVESYKSIARVCRDAVRKAKAQLELKLAVDVKNNKKGFFRGVNHKQKKKENIRRDKMTSSGPFKLLSPSDVQKVDSTICRIVKQVCLFSAGQHGG